MITNRRSTGLLYSPHIFRINGRWLFNMGACGPRNQKAKEFCIKLNFNLAKVENNVH